MKALSLQDIIISDTGIAETNDFFEVIVDEELLDSVVGGSNSGCINIGCSMLSGL